NDVLEFNYKWDFKKVWYVTPKLGGLVGHQWGDKSQGGLTIPIGTWAWRLTSMRGRNSSSTSVSGMLAISAALPAIGRERTQRAFHGFSHRDILKFRLSCTCLRVNGR